MKGLFSSIRCFWIFIFIIVLLSSYSAQPRNLDLKIDHVNIAVPDILKSSLYFSDTLGFTIKLGMLHTNSIENTHVKFKDKSYVELISASSPVDEVALWYMKYLEMFPRGAGAYLCLRVDEEQKFNILERTLENKGIRFNKINLAYSNIISFKSAEALNPIFIINYKRTSKDLPVFTRHSNTSFTLKSVWLNTPKIDTLRADLGKLGVKLNRSFDLPADFGAEYKWQIENKSVYFVETKLKQRIVGLSFLCEDLTQVENILKSRYGNNYNYISSARRNKILLYPENNFGMYMEFIELAE